MAVADDQVAVEPEAADEPQLTEDEEYFELMQVFVDTFEQIDRNYVSEIDRRELMEAAIRGMVAKLDPYSDYISPDELQQFTEEIEQEFGGVGIQVQFDPNERNIEIMSPLPGSPAYRAGLRPGDRVVAVDGKAVTDFPVGEEIETAISILKGEPGVTITVSVRRVGTDQVEDIPLTREIIHLDTVLGDRRNEDGSWDFMVDDERQIGYIRLTHFTRRSSEEMRAALNQLRSQGMRGLVLDLRGNPGGLLESAIDISDMFIENGVIVSTQGRNVEERTWTAKRFGTFRDFPMAVLINRFSASASEIVSACLQDHERAIIVGERSWGKASVQNVIELEEGESQLKLTTAGYHRPSGENIHREPDMSESDQWGVMPNEGYRYQFSFDELLAYNDDRRARDVLGSETPERQFVDTQFDAALAYVIEKLEAPDEEATESTEEDSDDAAAAVDEEAATEETSGDDAATEDDDDEAPAEEAEEAADDETSSDEQPQSRLRDPRLFEVIETVSPVVPIIPRPVPRAA
jgi:carboxyl-terminal processing protease